MNLISPAVCVSTIRYLISSRGGGFRSRQRPSLSSRVIESNKFHFSPTSTASRLPSGQTLPQRHVDYTREMIVGRIFLFCWKDIRYPGHFFQYLNISEYFQQSEEISIILDDLYSLEFLSINVS